MEVKIKDALLKGVEAHKAGKLQEADQFYTAILKAMPNHPDANHNMGVLAVGVGKIQEALPFFKTALEANSNIAQFWLSYIDALMKLNQIADAKAVLDEAKSKGIKSVGFDQIEKRLIGLEKGIEVNVASSKSQDPPEDQLQNLINLYSQGQFQKALTQCSQLLKDFPNSINLYNLIGSSNKGLGKLEEAIEAFKKALSLKPDFADAYYNMGNTLKVQGKLEEAIEAFKKALSLKPDFADAYNNMGIALKVQGKQEKAIEAFKKALSFKPDYTEAYYNMGIALKVQGKLEEAIEAFKKALSFKPDYAEAYNNMGNALQDHGKLDEAIDAFKKALSFKPDYTKSYWNLFGTSRNIEEAKKWIEQCLKVDPNYEKAKQILSALKFYEGDKSEFGALVKSTLKDHPYVRSFTWAFSLPKLPPLYFNRWALFDHMIELSEKNRPFYEFGVWRGEAFKHLIKTFKKGYGFDTFEGLPEDWHTKKAGTYSSEGNIPNVGGGEFIVGKFEDTLPEFFAIKRPMASIINFDADLYSSTICALKFSKPVIDEHTILIFDEFIMNENWEEDEYKALEEFCYNNHFEYEVLGISFFTKQVAVRLIAI